MATSVQPATIRAAGIANRDAIQELWQSTGLEPATPAEWAALLDGGTSTVLMAERDNQLVGAAIAGFDGWRAYIYHIAVELSSRRQGVGRALIEESERYLRSAGARDVFVMVHQDDTDGLALVGKGGYLPEGEIVLTRRLA